MRLLFFESIDSLNQFTRSLRAATLPPCNCGADNHWTSHGFTYKQLSATHRCVVGKRIICANRCGRTGCGATRQLYLSSTLPRIHYRADVLTLFIVALINGTPIHSAYQQATQANSHRHAYRWLHQMKCRLVNYRPQLASMNTANSTRITTRSTRSLLLTEPLMTTLQHFQSHWANKLVQQYQLTTQAIFL